MPNYTDAFAIPYPTLQEPPNGPAQMQAMADVIDDALGATSFRSGLSTARPAHREGMAFYETDTDTLIISDGGSWQTVWTRDWQTWTPVVQGGSTNINLGNGSVIGRYRQRGKEVTMHLIINTGSTTSWPTSGAFSFSLPILPRWPGGVAGVFVQTAPNKYGFLRNGHATGTEGNTFCYIPPATGSATIPDLGWGGTTTFSVNATYETA